MHPWAKNKNTGFTIVELLIVIAVIGILAGITVVAYNGVSQRATNTSIISTAKNSINLIHSYIGATGKYPHSSDSCLVPIQGSTTCHYGTGDRSVSSLLASELSKFGTLPTSVPDVGHTGTNYVDSVSYIYDNNRTFNGVAQPVVVSYSLKGVNQQCGVPNVSSVNAATMTTSTTGYTVGNYASQGNTMCVISVPGPQT